MGFQEKGIPNTGGGRWLCGECWDYTTRFVVDELYYHFARGPVEWLEGPLGF